MAELIKAFLFENGNFNVVDIDEDQTQKAEQDHPVKVCNPKQSIKDEVMAANPGVYKFFIDTNDLDSVELFEANFKEVE